MGLGVLQGKVSNIPWEEMPEDATVWITDLRDGVDKSGWYRNDKRFWKEVGGHCCFLPGDEGKGLIDIRYPRIDRRFV